MKLPLISLLCTLLLPSLSLAADKGFYVGGGIGSGSVDGFADTSSGVALGSSPVTMMPAISFAGIDGIPFDGSDLARNIFAGYRFNKTWSLQLGASDLGTYQSNQLPFIPTDDASLEIYEYSLVAKAQIPVSGRFSVNWRLGLTYNNFDIGGMATRFVFVPPNIIFPVAAPYQVPDNEVGYTWGFGAGWEMTSKIGLDLNFVRHETQVIGVDTLNLDLIYSF